MKQAQKSAMSEEEGVVLAEGWEWDIRVGNSGD
jgi:hypothetical protein